MVTGGAGQLAARAVQHRGRDVAGPLLDVGEVKVSLDHERWRRDLAQATEGRRGIKVRPDRWRPERNGVHVGEQPASLTHDTTLGLQWAVQPKVGLDRDHLIQVAGLLGLFQFGHQDVGFGRIDRLGRACHAGCDEDQGTDG